MLKLSIILGSLLLLASALVGCHADADINPHGSTAVQVPQ